MLATLLAPNSGGTEPENVDSPAGQNGKLVVKESGTSYIDSAHWKAILEEVRAQMNLQTNAIN
jgi:hypothetical protein